MERREMRPMVSVCLQGPRMDPEFESSARPEFLFDRPCLFARVPFEWREILFD